MLTNKWQHELLRTVVVLPASRTLMFLLLTAICIWWWLLLYSTILHSWADSLCSHVILHKWLAVTAVTWGWNGVSTESWPWRRKFSCRSRRDSNPQPFNHESSALTTELSLPPVKTFSCSPKERVLVVRLNPVTVTQSRQWEREECSFMLVVAVARFLCPSANTWHRKSHRQEMMQDVTRNTNGYSITVMHVYVCVCVWGVCVHMCIHVCKCKPNVSYEFV